MGPWYRPESFAIRATPHEVSDLLGKNLEIINATIIEATLEFIPKQSIHYNHTMIGWNLEISAKKLLSS